MLLMKAKGIKYMLAILLKKQFFTQIRCLKGLFSYWT